MEHGRIGGRVGDSPQSRLCTAAVGESGRLRVADGILHSAAPHMSEQSSSGRPPACWEGARKGALNINHHQTSQSAAAT